MDFRVGGVAGEESGDGVPVVLLHGLTATRRYVVHGSKALERGGHRVVMYDARGHGRSAPADRYDYDALAADLGAVLDDRGIDAAVLAGASMGAHTIARFALAAPARVRAAVLITPAFDPDDLSVMDRWDARAAGLRGGGDALEQVPRSRPFEAWDELGALAMPVTVVVSRDEADPEHPYAVGERWVAAIPGARQATEEPGSSPLAWQGGQLSRLIAEAAQPGGQAP
jgi:pimeloyl-ACP methyl ester carboxylesterase